jgi:LysM repeat protein
LAASFVFSLFFIAASPAEAGIFNIIKNIFKSDVQAESASVFNTQNMPLLDAPTNIDPLAGTGGGDINIVQNNALLSVTGPMGSIADIDVSSKNNSQISVYIVRDKDNISSIAKMFGVSINTVIWANDLKRGDLITPGQTLIILPVSGVQYVIKDGDTLPAIAKKFKGDIDEIINFNDLPSGGLLAAGQTIVIPNGESYPVSVYSRLIGGGGPSYSGYYIRPIAGGRKSQGLHGYNGVDLADYCGTPVVASASGDVIVSRTYGWNGGYGLYAVINHSNNTQTLYAHLSRIAAQAGWHVVQGQVIGYIGSTGNSTGCHVHFEIRGAKNPI